MTVFSASVPSLGEDGDAAIQSHVIHVIHMVHRVPALVPIAGGEEVTLD